MYSIENLVGDNAFSILAYVKKAMIECGYTKEAQDNYFTAATSGNYDNLLEVSRKQCEEMNEAVSEK